MSTGLEILSDGVNEAWQSGHRFGEQLGRALAAKDLCELAGRHLDRGNLHLGLALLHAAEVLGKPEAQDRPPTSPCLREHRQGWWQGFLTATACALVLLAVWVVTHA